MGVAWSVGVVAAKLDWLPALSRMPVALAASATLKVPTAVLAAAAPSVMVRVAVAAGGGDAGEGAAAGHGRECPGRGVCVGGERLAEVGADTVDFAVGVGVFHGQRAGDQDRFGAVGGGGGGEVGWLPAASRMPVALAGERDREAADGGVGGAGAFGDGEGGGGAADADAGEVAAGGDAVSVQRCGAGGVGGERFGEDGGGLVDLAVGVDVVHGQADEDGFGFVGGGGRGEGWIGCRPRRGCRWRWRRGRS